VDETLQLLLTALLGLATGIAATAWKSRKDLEVQYDIALRERRIPAYQELWKVLDRLAYYSPEQPLTYGVLKELATSLRQWYFNVGGLLMSARTREPYFDLQRALRQIVEKSGADDEQVARGTAIALQGLGSRLRTGTADDVATRVGPLLTRSLAARVEPLRRRRAQVRLTVTAGWTFEPDASAVWWVRVVNLSATRALPLARVWLEGRSAPLAEPSAGSPPLPTTLLPRGEWRGVVVDPDGSLLRDVADPLRAAWARGDGWRASSKPPGDAPPSPNPAAAAAGGRSG
jgi:hypothetical protein